MSFALAAPEEQLCETSRTIAEIEIPPYARNDRLGVMSSRARHLGLWRRLRFLPALGMTGFVSPPFLSGFAEMFDHDVDTKGMTWTQAPLPCTHWSWSRWP